MRPSYHLEDVALGPEHVFRRLLLNSRIFIRICAHNFMKCIRREVVVKETTVNSHGSFAPVDIQ